MKILVLTHNPKHQNNPYVGTLMNEVMRQDKEIKVIYGYRHFWTEAAFGFDIIHNMWSDVLRRGGHSLEDIKHRLENLRAHGVRIVSTCHNLVAHVGTADDAYGLLFSQSDAIFHLGDYSYRLLRELYPETLHVKGMHHVYDTIYPTDTVRCPFGDERKPRVICIGGFRKEEEREMIKTIALEMPDLQFICPSYCSDWREKLKVWRHRSMPPNMEVSWGQISERKLINLCRQSDIILVQRKNSLNSGNVTLGLIFGLVVVGPKIGNIAEILESADCPMFDPMSPSSLKEAMVQAIRLVKKGRGNTMRKYALKHYCTQKAAQLMINTYRILK